MNVPGNIVNAFSSTPRGVILHATRSGQPYDVEHEYRATVNYVVVGAGGLGWNLTIGPSEIAIHMTPRQWGYNAREHSEVYLAAEFAQANLGDPISDGQISAFCWWFMNVARQTWPHLPMEFPNHSELPAGIRDGKSDIEPRGQHTVRDRILARLGGA